jgi:hypothetical protein
MARKYTVARVVPDLPYRLTRAAARLTGRDFCLAAIAL